MIAPASEHDQDGPRGRIVLPRDQQQDLPEMPDEAAAAWASLALHLYRGQQAERDEEAES